MSKHLVTGGLGFIGTHLVDRLIETGEDVICLDNLSSGSKSNLKKWKNYPKFEFCLSSFSKRLFEGSYFNFKNKF